MSDIILPGSELSDGFWDGRQFRTVLEIVGLAPGAKLYVKASIAVPVLLNKINVTCDFGGLRVESRVGCSETAAFNGTVPVIPKNNFSFRPAPYHQSQVSIKSGGTVNEASGQFIDVIRRSTGSGSGRPSVGDNPEEVRGVDPASYYFIITSTGNQDASGVITSWWEELTQ